MIDLRDPIALARNLIDVPSVTDSEGAFATHLERILGDAGYRCERQEITAERFNLMVRAEGGPRVVLCSHLDTVPPFFPSREVDDFIFGRGACDTKGIIAAMISSGERLRGEGVRDFGYLFVVGEETDSIGAKVANEHYRDLGSEYIIVGEPTESKFVRASKGAFTSTVSFQGVAAHSAYAERGDSAVRKMVRAIEEIESTDWGEHPVLGKTTVNVGVVRGGERPNIVPGEAEMQMMFRTIDPPAAVAKRLQHIVRKYDGQIVRSHGNPPTFMTVPEGEEAIVVSFNTDVPHLSNLGKPLLFGPGSILDAHSADERIGKGEIIAAVETYRKLVLRLLAGH
jgi:acetylornithine deacetylase